MATEGVGDMQPMGESRQSNCALWLRPGHIPDMEYLFWRRRLQGILANASDSTMLRLLAADVTELAYHIQWHAEAPHAAQESLTATAYTILRDALVCKMCATDHLGTYASFVAFTDALSIPDTRLCKVILRSQLQLSYHKLAEGQPWKFRSKTARRRRQSRQCAANASTAPMDADWPDWAGWQRRLQKRLKAIRNVKAKEEYKTFVILRCKGQIPVELEEPLTPDVYAEARSKRRWENLMRRWRAAIAALLPASR